jgi:hypothetical protein
VIYSEQPCGMCVDQSNTAGHRAPTRSLRIPHSAFRTPRSPGGNYREIEYNYAMSTADQSNEPPGKPPKTAERIRATLETVRRAEGPGTSSGPLQGGLRAEDRLEIAAFFDADVARRFQQRLLEGGIMSSIVARRKETRVSVDYADRQRAGDLLEVHRRECPDVRPSGHRRDYDFALFGGALGATLGLIGLYGEVDAWQDALTLGGFTLLGALVGNLIDWLRIMYRRSGRLQFGVREFLIVVVLPALAVVLWRLLGTAAGP